MSSPNLLPASRPSRQTFDSSRNLLSPPPPLPPDSVYTSCYCEENIYLLAQTFLAEGRAPWEVYVVFISNPGRTVALWSQKLRAPNVVVWDYHVVLVLRPSASVPDIQSHDILRSSGNWEFNCTCTCVQEISPTTSLRVAMPQAPAAHQQPDLENGNYHNRRPCDAGITVGHVKNIDGAWVYDFDTTLAIPCSWRDYLNGTFPYALDDALKAQIDDRFHSLFRVIPADVYVENFASDRSHMIVRAPHPEAGVAGKSAASAILDSATETRSNGVSNSKLDAGQRDGGRDTEAIASSEIQYSSPPPPYPPLCGARAREQGVVHNLMGSFVAMDLDLASHRAAEEDEDLPGKGLRTSPGVGSSEDAGNTATTRAGDRSAEAGVRYGQVMDVAGFVRWLSGADDTSAPRWGS